MSPSTVVIVSPNWLGDAVMALPAMTDVRRHFPKARMVVAARASVADIFRLTPVVDEVVPLQSRGGLLAWRDRRADAAHLAALNADVAILFPNSFASAWLVRRSGTSERWGFASDRRRSLLTRAVPRPRGVMHQAKYYQSLVQALGIDNGPMEPEITLAPQTVAAVRDLLAQRGWDGRSPLLTIAPGAAYGKAKQWIPAHVTHLVTMVVGERGAMCALVGSRGDADTTGAIRAAVPEELRARVIDLAGATSLEQLAGVLAASHACVANDSGAMHLAAAIGVPLVALFGPTPVEVARPLVRSGGRAEVLTHPVWCRPCMLRECPIDHRCMTGITPARVFATLEAMR